MTITIERGRESTSRCACCRKISHTIRGFVSNNGAPYAVYFAGYTEQHADGIGTLIVSLGDWSEGATPDKRQAVLLKVRRYDGNIQFMVGSGMESPWDDVGVLGEILPRERALKHPRIADYYHVADHVVAEDERFTRYFTQ